MADGDRDRWNEKWSGSGAGTSHGSSLLALIGDRVPAHGRALDIGGGGSADSLELARRGLDVTVADVSDVGLAIAREQADAEGLTVHTVHADLERQPPPSGPWDLITVGNFLDRDLLPRLGDLLADGGVLAVVIATTTNLERHERPGKRYLVGPGELPTLVGDLDVVAHSEAWRPNDRHEAHLLARLVPPSPDSVPQ